MGFLITRLCEWPHPAAVAARMLLGVVIVVAPLGADERAGSIMKRQQTAATGEIASVIHYEFYRERGRRPRAQALAGEMGDFVYRTMTHLGAGSASFLPLRPRYA